MTDMAGAYGFEGSKDKQEKAIVCAIGNSTLGRFLAAIDGNNLCAVLFGDDDAKLLADLRAAFPDRRIQPGALGYIGNFVIYMMQCAIDRPALATRLEVSVKGGDFEQMTAAGLRSTKAGITITPTELALLIGASAESAKSIRALAASDILAVVTPFHRLQESDGTSPFYKWGEERRQTLLAREKANPNPMGS